MVIDSDYEYRDMLASTWDLLRGDMSDSPDRQFFRDIIQESGQPALDVGCGTGPGGERGAGAGGGEPDVVVDGPRGPTEAQDKRSG